MPHFEKDPPLIIRKTPPKSPNLSQIHFLRNVIFLKMRHFEKDPPLIIRKIPPKSPNLSQNPAWTTKSFAKSRPNHQIFRNILPKSPNLSQNPFRRQKSFAKSTPPPKSFANKFCQECCGESKPMHWWTSSYFWTKHFENLSRIQFSEPLLKKCLIFQKRVTGREVLACRKQIWRGRLCIWSLNKYSLRFGHVVCVSIIPSCRWQPKSQVVVPNIPSTHCKPLVFNIGFETFLWKNDLPFWEPCLFLERFWASILGTFFLKEMVSILVHLLKNYFEFPCCFFLKVCGLPFWEPFFWKNMFPFLGTIFSWKKCVHFGNTFF